eukprot:SAG31_NODE_20303_length_578_cov_0.962422_1_plen_96_part_00
MLVPYIAANGCATPSAPAGGPYNNTFKDDCDLDVQAAQTVKRLQKYFEWAKVEPKVIGFYPVTMLWCHACVDMHTPPRTVNQPSCLRAVLHQGVG